MNIKPISQRVNELTLKSLPSQPSKKKNKKTDNTDEPGASINLGTEVLINTHNHKLCRIKYNIQVVIEFKVEISMTYDFDFESDVELELDIAHSLLIRSEVPAYAYPYIKTYLENVMNMSGYGGFPLPYIDFQKNPMPSEQG